MIVLIVNERSTYCGSPRTNRPYSYTSLGPTQHTLTPPAVETLATADVETGPKLREHQGRKPLGEDVGDLGGRRNVKNSNIPIGNALANKVEIDLNMLRALMLDGV